jgi:spore germination protein KC
MKRKIIILLLLVIISMNLSSCYDSREIDDLAYVVGLGIDKGKSNILRLTLQIVVPSKSSSGEGEGGDGGGENTVITVVEVPTIYAGFNMLNAHVSKELNFSHVQIAVFSEELAREGIGKYIHALSRGREFRGRMTIAVTSDCTAEEYLENIKPVLEPNPIRYYELHLRSHEYTGYSADTTLIKFYSQIECSCRQAYSVLVGVNKYEDIDQIDNQNSTYQGKNRELPYEGDYYAGDAPRADPIKAEALGLAIFDGDKMIGKLDGEETMYRQMLYGDFKRAYMLIPDPLSEDDFILLDVKKSRNTKRNTTLEEESPKIHAEVWLEADILSIQSGEPYEEAEELAFLEKTAEDFLKKNMMRMLKKTQELNCDVCGFGRSLKAKYLTWQEWQEVNWLDRYKDAEIELEVDLKVRRPGLMIRTTPAKGTKGDVK